MLRRYVTDDTAPPNRAAACLLLLYAQPLSRIGRLTADDLTTVDGELYIHLGEPPSPVPAPFADLLEQLAGAAAASGTQWLFPGRLPGQPIAYSTLHRRLRSLGLRAILRRSELTCEPRPTARGRRAAEAPAAEEGTPQETA